MVIVPSPAPGLGYGGAEYGYSPYGSWAVPRQPYVVSSGYGGAPYGYGSYGSLDVTLPKVSGARALDSYRVEVYFSESVAEDVTSVDPGSYTLTSSTGAPTEVTSVVVGTSGDGGGYTSIILTHEGTTLGCEYLVEVSGDVVDVSGNALIPSARTTTFLALGSVPEVTVTATGGSSVSLSFDQGLLPEVDYSPGVEDAGSYSVSTDYVIPVVVESASQTAPSEVALVVSGMTSTGYDVTVGPALCFTYDATYLPSEATSFTGTEYGTGSSEVSASALTMSKSAGDLYGWEFSDDVGRMVPGSTFDCSVLMDASAAVTTPALYDATFARIILSDGILEVYVVLTRVSGIDVVEVMSGAYTGQALFSWSTGPVRVSLIRNQVAGVVVLLRDGVPILSIPSSSLTGASTIAPGVAVELGTAYGVVGFEVQDVTLMASSTLFTSTWNYVHELVATFVGSAEDARSTILTRYGPLVKDWGDATPATKADVVVRVNSVEVEVEDVNPYLGEIYLTIPIPLTTPGSVSVEVDYAWFPNPTFEFSELNNSGLVLNQCDSPYAQSEDGEASGVGVANTTRFPMTLVLPGGDPPSPKLIGHRFIGFQKSYTAALNSPTTLLLNQDPRAPGVSRLTASAEDVLVSYEGSGSATTSTPAWLLTGVDDGGDGSGSDEGSWIVKDDVTGAFGEGQAALYRRDEDLSLQSTTSIAVRLRLLSWTSDGVFTGVAFGVHDDAHLSMVGFLEVNGVKHAGVLLNASVPYLLSSWRIGPQVTIRILSRTTFEVLEGILSPGATFQIFDGAQAGVYEVGYCPVDDVYELLSPQEFPSEPTTWGMVEAVGYLAVAWDEYATYRMVYSEGACEVFFGGVSLGQSLHVDSLPAYPAQTVLLLPTSPRGSVFWGSASRSATSHSAWALVRYGVDYVTDTFYVDGQNVSASCSALPETEGWFVTEDFGYAVASTSLSVVGTSGRPGTTTDFTFGYARNLPYLSTDAISDVFSTFQVDSASDGAGAARVVVQDGVRRVSLGTIMYVEGATPHRRLVRCPSTSISGIRAPTSDGWTSVGSGVTITLKELPLTLTQEEGGSLTYESTLSTSDPDYTSGRVAEARISVEDLDTATGDGPIFGLTMGASPVDVAVLVVSDGIQLVTGTTRVPVGAVIPVDWSSGVHSIRLYSDDVEVNVYVDEVAAASSNLSSFSAGAAGRVYFGAVATSSSSTSRVAWYAAYAHSTPPTGTLRTIGVLKDGGTPTDIDGWELPRTDASTGENSSAEAVIEVMDWTSPVDVRLRLDATWGVTVFRPDLPPPPYYDGEFATEYAEPSAGWINVEYARLPHVPSGERFGRVMFGALNAESLSRAAWSYMRVRVFPRDASDGLNGENHVLNYGWVVNSGELGLQTTAEVHVVEVVTPTLVSLAPIDIWASRVFSVSYGDVVLGPDQWTFDVDLQAITLLSPVPSEHGSVTVTFAPGAPVTKTYLCSRPLLQSVTRLNEDVPPVPWSQVGPAERVIEFTSDLNDELDVLDDDFILNDDSRMVTFDDPSWVLYEQLDTCAVEEGTTNLISLFCDGIAPDVGLSLVVMSGDFFTDASSRPGGPAVWMGSNVATDGYEPRNPTSGILALSGGGYSGGVLGAHGAVIYPSSHAGGPPITSGSWSLYAAFTPDESELLEVFAAPTDDEPPTYGNGTDPDPTAPPSPGGRGSVVLASTELPMTYSRIGPWSNLATLSLTSLIGGGSAPTSSTFTLSGGSGLEEPPAPTVTRIDAS